MKWTRYDDFGRRPAAVMRTCNVYKSPPKVIYDEQGALGRHLGSIGRTSASDMVIEGRVAQKVAVSPIQYLILNPEEDIKDQTKEPRGLINRCIENNFSTAVGV